MSRIETSIVLRALAILQIVFMHVGLLGVAGGSSVLLAVLGFNLARFQLAGVPGANRSVRLLRTAAQIAIPSVLWAGLVAVVRGHYDLATVLLVNGFLPRGYDFTAQWELWFIEVAVWTMLGLAAAFAIPAVDRWERQAPFGFALVLLAAAFAARFLLTDEASNEMDHYVLATSSFFVMVGWTGARARGWRGRLLVTGVVLASVQVFDTAYAWELAALIGILVLLWVPWIPVPRPLVAVVSTLAGSSLFIYLVHWQVFPLFASPLLGALAGIAAGIVAWLAYRFVTVRLGAWRRRSGSRDDDPAGSRREPVVDGPLA